MTTDRTQHVYYTALAKGRERYIVCYDDASKAHALRQLGKWASNPELSFNWIDAAVLSQEIRSKERTP